MKVYTSQTILLWIIGLIIFVLFILILADKNIEPIENDCQPKRGELIIDGFTQDTLFVESSTSGGSTYARTKQHQTIRLKCGEFKRISQ